MKDSENITNVFRGSKEAILLISTPERCCLQKTRLLFSYDKYHMRCCGSSRGPVGRAICECSFGIGSLKGRVRFHSQ
jgi:hypothetical protein